MPGEFEKEAYPEPPRKTPAVNKQSALPDPALILSKLFYYSVDLPVTTFRGTEANEANANGKAQHQHRECCANNLRYIFRHFGNSISAKY